MQTTPKVSISRELYYNKIDDTLFARILRCSSLILHEYFEIFRKNVSKTSNVEEK